MNRFSFVFLLMLLLFFLLFPVLVRAQSEKLAFSVIHRDSIPPTYIHMGFGGGYFAFRDFATSPLFYHGLNGTTYLGRHKKDDRRESVQGFFYGMGQAFVLGTENSSTSQAMYLDIIHTELYQIPLNWNKWNLKAGGMISLTGNQRTNQELGNSSFAVEAMGTLFASAKLGRDISRRKEIKFDWSIIEFKLIPRKRQLFWQLNAAVVNTTYRNGFGHVDQSAIINQWSTFYNHEFKAFSGYRLKSSLEYWTYLKNNNVIKLSYHWDAYHTGKQQQHLEMTKHTLLISLLYSLNETITEEPKNF